MQRATCNELVTAAAYAKLRGLAKSTISRQLAEGKLGPRRPDGLIDVATADRGRLHNLSPTKCEQAVRRKRAAAALATPAVVANDGHAAVVPIDRDEHAAVVEAIRCVVSPAAVLEFAAFALRLGCSAPQAFAIGLRFMTHTADNLEEIGSDDVSDFAEPTDQQWREILGADCDLGAAGVAYDAVEFEFRPPPPPKAA